MIPNKIIVKEVHTEYCIGKLTHVIAVDGAPNMAPDIMSDVLCDEIQRRYNVYDEMVEALKKSAYALEYAASNLDGMTIDDLEDNVIESTSPSKTALIALRSIHSLLKTIQP